MALSLYDVEGDPSAIAQTSSAVKCLPGPIRPGLSLALRNLDLTTPSLLIASFKNLPPLPGAVCLGARTVRTRASTQHAFANAKERLPNSYFSSSLRLIASAHRARALASPGVIGIHGPVLTIRFPSTHFTQHSLFFQFFLPNRLQPQEPQEPQCKEQPVLHSLTPVHMPLKPMRWSCHGVFCG